MFEPLRYASSEFNQFCPEYAGEFKIQLFFKIMAVHRKLEMQEKRRLNLI